ncbi:manganese catalase family protein [Enterococcus faecalis]|uniref:manganese catalase family protein n=1 Tax=Enterococcus faecalis TaxID=1351 RepID=UPI000DE9DEDF|nr:manganese catalase family protein [Enterococcus faecalis]EGO8370727.1 manganese catalase family protein [Enterococcus faecalis]EGO8435322.1 manganese catalase family protein [Enterococcus faecalis]EHU8536723.1 manganese catalase family protein [Enterococcus faecalis]EIZ1163386.1 manganese catalase family protein [Enterococcus faecalis]EKG8798925.1 manganese catalase family protein [Enterococcus faecalis]
MFRHQKELQFEAKPDKPNPLIAKYLQELIGGQYGEMSVAMQYLFQGWSCRGEEKYKDMLMDIATEELGHVEMLATMVARLLEGAPVEDQEEAMKKDPTIGAIISGMNPQHAIVAGLGPRPADSVGNPWSGGYIIASGNMLADFRANLNAESQGRLQVARIYEMIDDRGVKDLLSVLLARDSYHQNLWASAVKELETKEGSILVPSTFPREEERLDIAYDFYNFSEGDASSQGSWASGKALDGEGEYQWLKEPKIEGKAPNLKPVTPKMYGTPKSKK